MFVNTEGVPDQERNRKKEECVQASHKCGKEIPFNPSFYFVCNEYMHRYIHSVLLHYQTNYED
jgi:hypothetical protein